MTVMTKKIRKMLAEGASTKDIVAKLKCKPQQVYQVRYTDKRKAEPKPISFWASIKQFFRSK